MSAAAPREAGGAAAFPWEAAMAIGLGRLAMDAAAFWAMTPREFAAALGPFRSAETPPSRSGLAALMARFPD